MRDGETTLMQQANKTYIRELPNNIKVRLCVEKVFKKSEDDNWFSLECRVCDGQDVGSLINIHFYRKKKDGGLRKDTSALFAALFPGIDEHIPSRKFEGRIFECEPWHPEGAKYQMFGRFKYVGDNDLF
jgi:hypothetical protein